MESTTWRIYPNCVSYPIYGNGNNNEHVNVTDKAGVWQQLFTTEFGIGANPPCQAPISSNPPIPSFSGPSMLCNNSGYYYADDAAGGIQGLPLEYNWTLELLANGQGTVVKTGSGQSFGITSNDHSPGYYRVTLRINYQGYAQSYSNFSIVSINVNCSYGGRMAAQEPTTDRAVTVFPNPSNGHITVNLPLLESEPATITLMNSQGAAVYKQTVTNQDQHKMDIVDQPSGLYLLRVSTGTRQWTKKVLINR